MLSIIIQAGGKSSRMGQDKALMPFLGQPLIRRVIERLSPIASEVLVTTNHPEAYEFLGVPCYPDIIPDRGALGGLFTALSVAKMPLVAVVGCDMPFASPSLLLAASQLLLDSDADIAIPQSDAGLEPLHAVYRARTCLPAIRTSLDLGVWKAITFHKDVDVQVIPPSEVYLHDPDRLTFKNVNTPEEFAQAESWARQNELSSPE